MAGVDVAAAGRRKLGLGTLDADRRPDSGIEYALDAFFASYGQILFRGSRSIGVLLFLATATHPQVGSFGALAVVTALLVARAVQLSSEQVRDGVYGFAALLVGLAVGASYEPSLGSLALVVAASVVVVPVAAAAHSALGGVFGLPPLASAFLVVAYLALSAGTLLGLGGVEPHAQSTSLLWIVPLPTMAADYLSCLGAIFFMPTPDAGFFVFLGLVVYSRIGVLLSILGFAGALLLGAATGPEPTSHVAVGYNFMLTAIALGGVWFVPSLSSFGLAAAGVLTCGLVTAGALPLLEKGELPLLVLPFNTTVLLVLYAMRQRVADGRPKAVDFAVGSPEENLGFFQTRHARFGANYAVRLHAPFAGTWTCTHGTSGEFTHRGPWRHACDFEVDGRDGRTHVREGLVLEDYHAYKLPILSPAAGRVVHVVDGVPDNPVAKPNLEENWGNLVLIELAPRVYALLCHFSPGTIAVAPGQVVRRGQQLGSCGNSGRSEVPHLHFHLQAEPRVGAGTIPFELHDVVVGHCSGPALRATWVPEVGDRVRNVRPDARTARMLELRFGEPFELIDDAGHHEQLIPDVDLFGSARLVSPSTGARMYYEQGAGVFTVYDVLGPRHSALHLLHAALARVPLEASDDLTWSDALFRARGPRGWLWPFGSISMHYRRRSEAGALVVEGKSSSLIRGRAPLLETRAVIDAKGLRSISVTHRGRTRHVRRRTHDIPVEKESPKWSVAPSLS